MKIIDRYMLRQFVNVFLICFISLTGLYVVLNAFSNLDTVLKNAESSSLFSVVSQFCLYPSIGFFEKLSGVISLIAAVFTVTWIQRNNELTALMAAGISRARVVKPVITACVVIAMLTAAGREMVIPRIRNELSRNANDVAGESAQQLHPRTDNQTGILLGGKSTYANEQRIELPSFVLPADFAGWGAQHVTAANAFYLPAQDGRPSGYLLKEVKEPAQIATKPSLEANGERIIITPQDAPDWLASDQCFVKSDITFEQLAGGQQWRQFSVAELVSCLRNPSLDYGADVRVAIHVRVTQPIFDVTLLFLGLPLILARESRNMFLSIGLCVGLVSVYSLTVLSCQYLGTIYVLSPALSVFLPLMVYIPMAVALFERVRR